MSQWNGCGDDSTYYILVDSKPSEIVDTSKPDTIFCTAFVNTASCINGVKNPDLPWFKQYKECESLDESKFVIKSLINEINNGNFQDLYLWVLSSHFSTIDKNGLAFLEGMEKELSELSIAENHIKYKNDKFNIDKAKMLVWYNFCLCNMATYLVDKTLQWKQNRGVFFIDRLGDSDKRIQNFMRMVMLDSSLNKLWRRCAEAHKEKPDHIGYEFPSHRKNDKIVPAQNSMQASLVDWLVLAGYAAKNGIENREPEFQSLLIDLIKLLDKNKQLNGMHFNGNITWA